MLPFAALVRPIARRLARKAAFGTAAGLCLLAGAGFLLAALWSVLATMRGAVFASCIIGLLLAGIGLVFLALALSRPRRPEVELDDELVDRLQEAARGGPGEMERALRLLLIEAGLTPPKTGSAASLAAAVVYGFTLGLSRRRR